MSNNQENAEQQPQAALTDLERPDEAVELTDEQSERVVGGKLKVNPAHDPMDQEAGTISQQVCN